MERDGAVLVRVRWPDAEPHVHPGRFGGVVVEPGEPSALYSDGTQIS